MIPDNQHESDNRFHDNLSEICARIEVPAGPAHELRSRCDAILKGEVSRTQKRSVLAMMKQPKVLSAMGLEQTPFSSSGFLPAEPLWEPGNPRGLKSAARYTERENALASPSILAASRLVLRQWAYIRFLAIP